MVPSGLMVSMSQGMVSTSQLALGLMVMVAFSVAWVRLNGSLVSKWRVVVWGSAGVVVMVMLWVVARVSRLGAVKVVIISWHWFVW